MFELEKKQKPKTLSECTQPDSVVTHLYVWARTVRIFGIIVWVGFGIYGIIHGVETASAATNIIWGFLSGFVAELMYGILIYCSTLCIGVLLIALANIVYNTQITANINMMNCEKETVTERKLEQPKPVVEAYSEKVPKETQKQINPTYKEEETMWICRHCGTKNLWNVRTCKDCCKVR
ncbi:MAG: hypothetical protein IKJ55_01765 [Clostridia bacterium]|nr:hypothetical protein [Clostridia bacterium]